MRRISTHRRAVWPLLALVLAAIACNAGAQATDIPTLPPTPTTGPTITPEPTEEPTPACVPDSEFVADVTIPDGTLIEVGEVFVKTWRLRNNGTCPWDARYALVQTGGDKLFAAGPVPLPSVQPGEEIEISVSLQLSVDAPVGSEQVAAFQMRDPDGTLFGGTPYVIITAAAAREDESPPTPTPIAGSTSLGAISGIVWDDHCSVPDGQTPSEGCVEDEEMGYRANGLFDSGEERLQSVVVDLRRAACPASGESAVTFVTNADGMYAFVGLAAGTYCVSINALSPANSTVLIPGGWTYPPDADQGVAAVTVTLGEGESRTGVDFGWDFQLD